MFGIYLYIYGKTNECTMKIFAREYVFKERIITNPKKLGSESECPRAQKNRYKKTKRRSLPNFIKTQTSVPIQ